jgi:hypothetical protein
MSRGRHYVIKGHLLRSQVGLLVLRRDGGGTRQLDAPSKMLPLIGQQVKGSGTRAGFDLIDSEGLVPA